MDERLQRLYRQAQSGDYQAQLAWKAARKRAGHPTDLEEIAAPLTSDELTQSDYDEIWWHAKKRLRFGWDWEPRGGLVKAHHPWGHRHGDKGENSKRKTLRTHREGSRRRHKFKRDRAMDKDAPTEAARKRKKRFGGRAHRVWLYRGEYGPWIFEVNLDD